MPIQFTPIGIVHSPFKSPSDIHRERNIRPDGFADITGEIELLPELIQGLKDIDGFSHLIIIFNFHRAEGTSLTAHPPFDSKERGVFSTRSPRRPNPLGVTVVRLIKREGNRLFISGLDMIEGTPVLDIKPYTGRDRKENIRQGWLDSFQNDCD